MSTTQGNYKVTIEKSSRELTAREKLKVMDTTGAEKLNEITENGVQVEIKVSAWAVLHIENDKAEDKEYSNYVIMDTDGAVYTTGSSSFGKAFEQIAEVMKDEPEEDFTIRVFSRPSKNFKGKSFLTCSLV
jgi:hypothetical protein